MLKSLYVKNYALLSEIEIEFGPGFNILTGETGAGKSIIIGALGTILGERVDMSMLRPGSSKAVIEGVFTFSQSQQQLRQFLHKHELSQEDDQLILRREIYDNSRSRAFINDSPVQLSVLQQVSDRLVDLHGQHEHQSLLKVQNHLSFLDEYGNFAAEQKRVFEKYKELQEMHSKLNELQKQQKSLAEKRELYSFQIQEIEKVNPSMDEEEFLLKEEKVVRNSERLFGLTDELYKLLYEDEHSAYDILSRVDNRFQELHEIDESFNGYLRELNSARITIEEVSKYLQSYKSKIEFNPQRIEDIQNRISELSGLRKKFGMSIHEIIKHKEDLKSELANLENIDLSVNDLSKDITSEKKLFSELCLDLSRKRKQAAEQLQVRIPEILMTLGMSNARFKVALKYQDDPFGWVCFQGKNTYRSSESGIDFAEFMMSANKGVDLRPLAKVASGGEISRIMLALKSVLANQGRIPVLIFDEIDSGVSGRVAQSVGRKLKDLSRFHQVICITHLPQIASLGEHHFSVVKREQNAETEISINKLGLDERTAEIAKLLAGEKVSEAHLNSARELLQEAAS